jgi:hypothetical protein
MPLGADGFFIISVASAGVSAIFTHFRLKNLNIKNYIDRTYIHEILCAVYSCLSILCIILL